MKAMILNNYGSDAKFERTDIEKPVPTPHQVLVRIKASSVNTIDTMIKTMGEVLPLSPALIGMDFAGVVESLGSKVTDFDLPIQCGFNLSKSKEEKLLTPCLMHSSSTIKLGA